MSQSANLAGAARAMGELHEQLRWGKSVARPGLVDTLTAANHHMHGLLDQVRALHESRVEELRDRNLAAPTA